MNKTLENILKGTVLTGFAMSTFLPIDSPMLGNGQYLNAQEKQETQTTQASQDAKKKEEQKKQKEKDKKSDYSFPNWGKQEEGQSLDGKASAASAKSSAATAKIREASCSEHSNGYETR